MNDTSFYDTEFGPGANLDVHARGGEKDVATFGRLGCAERYDVLIHGQGGGKLFANVAGLVALSWSRKLDDFSEASITVSKQQAGSACCARLGQVRPWAHELSIYREGVLVWQGPIMEISEKRTEIEFSARDMLMWFDRRTLNPTEWSFYGRNAWMDPIREEPKYYWYPNPANSGWLADKIIRDAFPPNLDPGLAAYMRVDIGPPSRRPATLDKHWHNSTTVGEVLRDLLKVGCDMFTMGRRVYFLPDDYRTAQARRAPYRITEDDFLAELEIRQSGLDLTTFAVVSGGVATTTGGDELKPPLNPNVITSEQQRQDYEYPPIIGISGRTEPGYGLVQKFSSADQATDQGIVDGVARAMRAYGFPPPVDIIVPSGAQLSPEAPITINQLVPGRPFLLMIESYCQLVRQIFRLNEVSVTWNADEVEAVAVSLVSNGPPEGSEE